MRASGAFTKGFLTLVLPIVGLAGLPGCDSKPGSGEVVVGGAVVDPAVEAANEAATKDNADLPKKPDAKKAR